MAKISDAGSTGKGVVDASVRMSAGAPQMEPMGKEAAGMLLKNGLTEMNRVLPGLGKLPGRESDVGSGPSQAEQDFPMDLDDTLPDDEAPGDSGKGRAASGGSSGGSGGRGDK
eukprot:3500107-Rhodomonas_salina.1